VALPLFPGYLFVRITSGAAARITVLKTPGVLEFVGKAGSNSIVPDQEIENVRAVVSRGSFFVSPFLKTGQRVRIRGGVLDGLQGILCSHKGATTLVVSVELIQRSISISLDGYDVEAA
jgi:transcriptional antiterminator RfaH